MKSAAAHDPKAGEKTYYAQLGEAGRCHAKAKPFSDVDCGKYLCNLGALLLMLEPPEKAVLDFGGVLFAFEPGAGHSASSGAKHAVETYGVHEKDMPPLYVWTLGKRAGFKRKLFLPLPHETGRSVYRRDYLRVAGSGWKLWFEKVWGYFRAGTKAVRTGRSGLIVMWK
jgi:hypothetical protein